MAMKMLYFLLHYGNIYSLVRLFYKISYIFMIRKIVRKCAVTRIRPLVTATYCNVSNCIQACTSQDIRKYNAVFSRFHEQIKKKTILWSTPRIYKWLEPICLSVRNK